MDLARRACVREVHLMMGKSQFKTVISGTNLGFMVKMGLVNHPSTGICSRSESGVDGGLHHALAGDEISCVMFRVALSFCLLQLYALCLQLYCKGFTMTELQV
jgi:hypothetical protein